MKLKLQLHEALRMIINRASSSHLLKSFSWNLAGNLFSKGAVFITSLLAANLLGAEDFGRIGIIQQTTAMMITFSVMGLAQTAILFVGRNLGSSILLMRITVNRVIRIGWITTIVTCLIYLLLSNYIASAIFEDPSLEYLLKICTLVLITSSINQIQFGVLSGFGRFDRIAFTNIFIGFISLPITYLLMQKLGLEGFIIALAANSWLTFLFNKFFIYKELQKEHIITKNELTAPSYKALISYATSNLIGAVLFTASSWFALGVLTRKAGLIDVAALNASMQVFSIISLAPAMLAQVLMSITSKNLLSGTRLKNIIMITFFLMVLTSLFFSIFSSEILYLYNAELKGYTAVLNYALVTVIIASIINLLDHYANGLGLVKVRIISHFVFAIFYVTLTINWVDSALSLMIAMLVAYCCRFVALCFLLRKKLS